MKDGIVAARRISQATRNEVGKKANRRMLCFTFDELLEKHVDFSLYFEWLEDKFKGQGIDTMYVPLACLKEEFDPTTKEKMGESHYDGHNGWMDGYIDVWLDDPAREHISILGESGAGKTWFALHYAWLALQRYRQAKERGVVRPRLPLYISLRDYAKAASLESFFSWFFFRKYRIRLPGYSTFEQLNRMGRFLLIFDGFEGMGATVNRQKMIDSLWELAKVMMPGSKVILTCRTEYFTEAKEAGALFSSEWQSSTVFHADKGPRFTILELKKWEDAQIRKVL